MSKPLMTEDDLKALWDRTMGLPPVQNLIAQKWHVYLPPAVATTFLGVALTLDDKLKGDWFWLELEGYVSGVLRAQMPPEKASHVEFIDKRFRDYYGDYDMSFKGLLKVLRDLGLIVQYHRRGQDIIEIPTILPTPEDRLGLCLVDVDEHVTFKARYRNDGSPRHHVEMGDVPAIKQMLNAGWGRHLPSDVAQAFMAATAVSINGIVGDVMWENIEDLYKAQVEYKRPLMPKRKAEEVQKRFAEEYGKPYEKTARGAIAVLLDLGLLVLTTLDGEDYLVPPEVFPTPDLKLSLSDKEKYLLAERLKIIL